jgi:hypothetical protein
MPLTAPPIVALRVTHPVTGTAYFSPEQWAEVCNAPNVDLEREGITVEPLVRLADVERTIEDMRRIIEQAWPIVSICDVP